MSVPDGLAGRLLFSGYYGHRNTGDDAFIVVADQLCERWGVSGHLLARPQHLPPNLQRVRAVLPARVMYRGSTRLRSMRAALKATATLHLGGSVFQHVGKRLEDERRLSRLYPLKIAALGVSVGPFETRDDAKRIRQALQPYAAVSVRDEASADRLDAVGYTGELSIGFDPAVILRSLFVHSTQKMAGQSCPTVAVALASPGDRECSDIVAAHHERLSYALRRLIAEGLHIKLLVFSEQPNRNDALLVDRVSSSLPKGPVTVLPYGAGLAAHWAAIAGSTFVIAERLHAGIFAFAAGVPYMCIAYAPKCIDFARYIRLPEHLISWRGDHDLIDRVLTSAAHGKRCAMRVARAESLFATEADRVYALVQ